MTAGQTNARLEIGGRDYWNRLEQRELSRLDVSTRTGNRGLCLVIMSSKTLQPANQFRPARTIFIFEDNVPQPCGHEHAWVDTGSGIRTGLTEQKFDRLSARLNEREGAASEHVAAGNFEAAYRLSETVEVEVGLCSKAGEQSPLHAHPRSDGPALARVEHRFASDTLPNQIRWRPPGQLTSNDGRTALNNGQTPLDLSTRLGLSWQCSTHPRPDRPSHLAWLLRLGSTPRGDGAVYNGCAQAE
ncbi:hypothetical protein B0H17DRAFT_1254472 [Mycena rosella]|uniref:Uncharacterized protein n=1 Tax=Mycena rosella TaxID=1033263 RepID=A0AAD7G869_MYCRO|nr:hypothetical protein B0H17DRAFT_1254472 [Mycena rosella]